MRFQASTTRVFIVPMFSFALLRGARRRRLHTCYSAAISRRRHLSFCHCNIQHGPRLCFGRDNQLRGVVPIENSPLRRYYNALTHSRVATFASVRSAYARRLEPLYVTARPRILPFPTFLSFVIYPRCYYLLVYFYICIWSRFCNMVVQ